MPHFIQSIISNPGGILLNIAAIGFVFGLIIFIHEFGHFIVAKKIGVKVEQFSFGFGREIFGFQWGETRYTLNWVPLGGFVRMSGETPEDYEGPKLEGQSTSTADNPDRAREFLAQPWFMRILVALAGPFMNYVLAAVIFFSMLVIWGEAIQVNKTEVGEVLPGHPAAQIGILPGDNVVSVNGQSMEDFMAVAMAIHDRPELATEIVVKRKGQTIKFTVVPEKDKERGGIGLIGIKPAAPLQEHKKIGVLQAAQKSLWQCWNVSHFTIAYLVQKIHAREKPDMAGPVGITQVIVKAVKAGMEDFLFLIAMISLAIGLFNLFPIPMLDGSHVLYYLIEAVRKKPMSTKTLNKINVVGVALLMALMIFATVNDIQRIAAERGKPNTTQK